jgi:hypothetical protein
LYVTNITTRIAGSTRVIQVTYSSTFDDGDYLSRPNDGRCGIA